MNIGWQFDNTYSNLSVAFKEEIKPIPVNSPELIVLNEILASELNLNFSKIDKKELSKIFSGNVLPNGSNSIAQAYAGHQFGHFTMLGDGRAVLIGEHKTKANKKYDIQFKGSGKTAFSRNGDGRAALGPMLREYIISEAMNGLNIPTTRSLAVVKTGESIQRETTLQGAILTRIASSHIRVGTFQYIASRQKEDELKILLNYTIDIITTMNTSGIMNQTKMNTSEILDKTTESILMESELKQRMLSGGFNEDITHFALFNACAKIFAINDLKTLAPLYEKGCNDLQTFVNMYDTIESASEEGQKMAMNHMYMWDKDWWEKGDLESRAERIANILFVLVTMEFNKHIIPNVRLQNLSDIDFKGFHLISYLLKFPDKKTVNYLKCMRTLLADHINGVQFNWTIAEAKKEKKRKKAKKNRKKKKS